MARQPLISTEIIRANELDVRVDRYCDNFRRRAVQALNAAGLIVQNAARRSVLDGPKSGRLYKRGTITHRASAPGQPPASDTGTLVRSIVYEVDETDLIASITAGTMYAKFLEFGTRHMAPRPFMNPALTNNRPKVLKAMRAILKGGAASVSR